MLPFKIAAVASLATALFAAKANAAPIRVLDVNAETSFNQQFAMYLRPQGIVLRGVPLYWVDDLFLDADGQVERLEIGSVLHASDAIGNPLELQCASTFLWNGEKAIFDARLPLNPSCVVNTTPSPMSEAEFALTAWYPHAGPVDRYSFRKLYEAFSLYLTRRGYPTPAWDRDAWILRANLDADLQVQRLWIFASTLIDRESLDVEKRADCHGEVIRPAPVSDTDKVPSPVDWQVSPTYTCRIQLYRYGKICYGPQESDCEEEWSPE